MRSISFQQRVADFYRHKRLFLQTKRPENLRLTLKNYATLFSRDFSSLLIQTLYFLLLANTLTLADMGVFTAVLSIGMILGSLMGLGYDELSYRTAVRRPLRLGHYLAGTYFVLLLTVPIGLLVSGAIYSLVFANKLTLISFLEVIIVELLFWRLIETYAFINEGLGHFGKVVKGFVLAYSMRAIAAFTFWYSGVTDLSVWIHFYLFANILAFGLVWLLYSPKARLRLNIPIVLARLGQSSYLSFTHLMHTLQREIDKVIILVLSGNEATGIYAISMRVLALIAMPIQPFFGLYIRKMLKVKDRVNIVRNNLLVEAAIFVIVITGFVILMQILQIAPNLLGKNVAAASFFYSGLIVLPAFKILMEFHSELYFAFDHNKDRALASVILSAAKTAMMVVIVMMAGTIGNWTVWMNLSFALLYLVSLAMVYPVLTGRFKNIPAMLKAGLSRQ